MRSWYFFLSKVGMGICRILARVTVEGLENIPKTGPFFLVPNHQSVLDPVFAQGPIFSNDIYTIAKSTQFSGVFFRWLMPRINAFPTRRYRVDAQTVRTALRFLSEGKAVGVYPEGERTWDGRLQTIRAGTVRLLLKGGVPVIPVGIDGSYDVWPRWSKTPRRRPVTVRYGKPIFWGVHNSRSEREPVLAAATRELTRALNELSGPAWANEALVSGPEPVKLAGRPSEQVQLPRRESGEPQGE